MRGPLIIRRAEIDAPEAVAHTSALAAEVAALYDDDDPPLPIPPAEVALGRGAFLIAYLDGQPAGCGALRRISEAGLEHAGEVKRMYVTPAARRRGVGRAILAALEAEARRLGLVRLVLETGDLQPEAIAMYRAAGWFDRARFGEGYTHPLSVFMEKGLA